MISGITMVSAGVLLLFALHRAHLLWLLRRCRRCRPNIPNVTTDTPMVTVQLPLFNEVNVAARAIESLCALDWPHDRLHIQVCDDSTDDTLAAVDFAVMQGRSRGLTIDVLRRPHRHGYKAGALAAATVRTSSPFICIVDADFMLPTDFLRRMMPSFVDDQVGMVQARWGHLNRHDSWLTRLQAIFLDAHFSVEHAARSSSGRWFNFNGTAGVWRRSCIEDAGGWQGDTLSEDVDLSYRAQLRQWRFIYRNDVVAPAELPNTWSSFLRQQRRWMVGLWQVSSKLLPSLWRVPSLPLQIRIEATMHVLAPIASMVTVAFIACGAGRLLSSSTSASSASPAWWAWFAMVTVCITAFFAVGQRRVGLPTWPVVMSMPVVMVMGAVLAVSNVCGIVRSMWRQPVFERTHKSGELVAHERMAQ